MRVVKNMLQTSLHFLLVFGVITLLALVFLYANPGGSEGERTFRLEPKSAPITLDEYRTIFDPDKPDPRHKEYRHAFKPKQAARD